MTATIHVCRSCQDREPVRRQLGDGGSAELMAAIAARLRDLPGGAGVLMMPQACLGPCGAGVRVALTGPGRWGWLFEGLQPGADLDALADFLVAWRTAPHGVPAKADRPARLLRKTVGRLPPSSATG